MAFILDKVILVIYYFGCGYLGYDNTQFRRCVQLRVAIYSIAEIEKHKRQTL